MKTRFFSNTARIIEKLWPLAVLLALTFIAGLASADQIQIGETVKVGVTLTVENNIDDYQAEEVCQVTITEDGKEIVC